MVSHLGLIIPVMSSPSNHPSCINRFFHTSLLVDKRILQALKISKKHESDFFLKWMGEKNSNSPLLLFQGWGHDERSWEEHESMIAMAQELGDFWIRVDPEMGFRLRFCREILDLSCGNLDVIWDDLRCGYLPSLKLAYPLKMDGWNTTFLLGWPIFRCYVSFREGKLAGFC